MTETEKSVSTSYESVRDRLADKDREYEKLEGEKEEIEKSLEQLKGEYERATKERIHGEQRLTKVFLTDREKKR